MSSTIDTDIQATGFAASIIENGASTFASYATNLLLERHPRLGECFPPDAMEGWKMCLTQRLLELSAALEVDEAALFVGRVRWSDKAFRARGIPTDDLRLAFETLGEILHKELPPQATPAVDQYFELGLQAIAEGSADGSTDEFGLDPALARDRLALEYLLTVLEGDTQKAIQQVIDAVEGGLSVQQAYLEVLAPAQTEIGRMWHRDEVGIAEEHLVTSTTRKLMAILSYKAASKNSCGKTVVAAAVSGNIHDVGIQTVADFFVMDGWKVIPLGANVPPEEISMAVQYFNAQLLVLSATLSAQLRPMRQTIETVHDLRDRQVQIMVGGQAFNEAPELWRKLGADGYTASADQAVLVGRQLVGL